jgi:AraC-like DNA-binding protein/mannose-6-phosphate isomerase-like protein (cupin superfamily)
MTTRFRMETFSPSDRLLIADVTLENGGSFPPHRHDFSELAIVLGGTATHEVEDESFPIRAGDVFVIHGNTVHGLREARDLSLCNIMYDPGRYPGFDTQLAGLPGYHALFQLEPHFLEQGVFGSRLHLRPADVSRVTGILDSLRSEFEAQSPGYVSLLSAHFAHLAVFLARAYGARGDFEDSRVWRLATTISYMDAHFREPLSVDDLARRARLSTSHFCREFKAAMGTSPIDYVLRRRVAEACELMREPARSVTEIGIEVGFSDGNYFSRQFKRVMGRSPREYRRSL